MAASGQIWTVTGEQTLQVLQIRGIILTLYKCVASSALRNGSVIGITAHSPARTALKGMLNRQTRAYSQNYSCHYSSRQHTVTLDSLAHVAILSPFSALQLGIEIHVKVYFCVIWKGRRENVGFSQFSVLLHISLSYYVNSFMEDPGGRQ